MINHKERSKLGGFVLGGSQVCELENNHNFDYNSKTIRMQSELNSR